MKLTPLDIRHKEFKRGMRGYVDSEVDEFLDDIADEFERLFRENIELGEKAEALEEKISHILPDRRDPAEDAGLGPAERRRTQAERTKREPADPAGR